MSVSRIVKKSFRARVIPLAVAVIVAAPLSGAPRAASAAPASNLTASANQSIPSSVLRVTVKKLKTKKPRISGSAVVGNTLKISPGKWTEGTKYFYRWYLAGKPIKGKAGSKKTLKVTNKMVGKKLRVEVTGAKPGFETVMKRSKATPKVRVVAQKSGPQKTHTGIVWASQVDPARINQPIASRPMAKDSGGIVSRIDMIIFVNPKIRGELGDSCAEEIKYFGDPGDKKCIYVQWSFDVPRSYRGDEGGLSPETLLTPKGRQVIQAIGARGVPGAKNVSISAMYAGGVPGSTLRWDTGSNDLRWETFVYEIPTAERFLPIDFG